MKFNPEFFSSEVIMQRLVEWFNTQPLNQRTITAGEFVIIRVKVLVTPNGEPVFIIGSDPSDIADPTREYIGEAVFIWVGPRGTDLTATISSFFEISKFVNSTTSVNIRPFNAVVKYPPVRPPLLRMAYGWQNPSVQTGGFSVGLTGRGVPDVIPSDPYTDPTFPLENITDLSTYGASVAARRADGTVWGWGGYFSHPIYQLQSTAPSQIPFDRSVRRIVMLNNALVALHDDGTISMLGDTAYTPIDISTNPNWGDAWTTGGFDGMLPNISDYTNIVDIKGYARTIQGDDSEMFEQYVILQHADGHLAAWGARFDFTNPPTVIGGPLAIINQTPVTQTDTFDVNHGLLFTLHSSGEVSLVGESSSSFDITAQVDGELCVKVAVTANGSIGYIDTQGRAYVYPLNNAGQSGDGWLRIYGSDMTAKVVDMSGGQDHVVIATEVNDIKGVTGNKGGAHTSSFDNVGAIRQVFAGNKSTGVLLSNGQLKWYYGYD